MVMQIAGVSVDQHEAVHSRCGFGESNVECERTLELYAAMEKVANMYVKKPKNKLVACASSGIMSRVD